MGEVDLSVLEEAAAKAGLPGMVATSVQADPRRSDWFTWRGTDLRVSEAVLERCPPQDGAALLVDAICCHRRRCTAEWTLGLIAVGIAGIAWLGWFWPAIGLAVVLAIAVPIAWGKAMLSGDDDAVAILGTAEPLVRGFNRMAVEELHLGRWQVGARPDLHRRAERLVRKHGLVQPRG